MSWEVCERGHFGSTEGSLGAGQVAMQKNGVATLPIGDLKAIGIIDRCVVLGDPGNMRVGLRAANGDDASVFSVRGKKGGKTVQVNVMQALRKLGVNPEGVRGRYSTISKDRVIFWTVTELTSAERTAAQRPPIAPPSKK